MVRTECLKLVTIGIWNQLGYEGKREQLFSQYPNLLKLWNSSNKKMNAAGNVTKGKGRIIYTLAKTYFFYIHR